MPWICHLRLDRRRDLHHAVHAVRATHAAAAQPGIGKVSTFTNFITVGAAVAAQLSLQYDEMSTSAFALTSAKIVLLPPDQAMGTEGIKPLLWHYPGVSNRDNADASAA